MTKIRLYSNVANKETYCDINKQTSISLEYFIEESSFQSKPENVQYFQWLLYIASRQKGIYLPYYIMLMAKRIYEYDLEYAYKGE